MIVQMIAQGKASFNGYETTYFQIGQDISSQPEWLINHFLNTGKAQVIETVIEIPKKKVKRTRKAKVVHSNKMIKSVKENKGK